MFAFVNCRRAVRSTVPGDNYATFSGTSMATPHVAGVAALLWSHFPECTNNQIRNALLHGVREPPTSDPQNAPGWDIFYGYGIVNAGASFELLKTRGCVGAGGRFPDTANGETLSDQSPGGGDQLQFGCTDDSHCTDQQPNPCLGDFTCDLTTNTCVEGPPSVNCDDGLLCTIDTCDPTRDPDTEDLCVHTPVVCDDGETCNGVFSCDPSSGQCVETSPPISCDDGLPCTLDTCSGGTCSHAPKVCDDGDVCNGVFSCDASSGECVEDAPPVVCELETQCNLASCDALSGECSYTPRVCDDGNACTLNDSCDVVEGCVFQDPEPNCCGNGICEPDAPVPEDEESCQADCAPDAPIGGAPTWTELFPWQNGKCSERTIMV